MRLLFAVVTALLLTPGLQAQRGERPSAPVPVDPTAPARVVPVSVNGDSEARFVLVVMSDGYTAADMPTYRAQVDKHLNVLWSIEPFRSYRNYINVFSVEIPSPESGITCDPEVGIRPCRRATRAGRNAGQGASSAWRYSARPSPTD
jgi:hypothetical protein